MRACVFATALAAISQPAFAHSHSHYVLRHHAYQPARHHHAVGHRKFPDQPFPFEGRRQPVTTQAFGRTDATDAPIFAQAWSQPPSYAPAAPLVTREVSAIGHGALDAMIARHAQANGIPVSLVHRVVLRESRYNPRASS